MLGSLCCLQSSKLGGLTCLYHLGSAILAAQRLLSCLHAQSRSPSAACGSIFTASLGKWWHLMSSVCYSTQAMGCKGCAGLCMSAHYATGGHILVSIWHGLRLMQEWREVKLQGRDMLQQPQPHFEAFKALFSHGVLGFSFSGRPIWLMKVCLSVSVAMLDAFLSDDIAT